MVYLGCFRTEGVRTVFSVSRDGNDYRYANSDDGSVPQLDMSLIEQNGGYVAYRDADGKFQTGIVRNQADLLDIFTEDKFQKTYSQKDLECFTYGETLETQEAKIKFRLIDGTSAEWDCSIYRLLPYNLEVGSPDDFIKDEIEEYGDRGFRESNIACYGGELLCFGDERSAYCFPQYETTSYFEALIKGELVFQYAGEYKFWDDDDDDFEDDDFED